MSQTLMFSGPFANSIFIRFSQYYRNMSCDLQDMLNRIIVLQAIQTFIVAVIPWIPPEARRKKQCACWYSHGRRVMGLTIGILYVIIPFAIIACWAMTVTNGSTTMFWVYTTKENAFSHCIFFYAVVSILAILYFYFEIWRFLLPKAIEQLDKQRRGLDL